MVRSPRGSSRNSGAEIFVNFSCNRIPLGLNGCWQPAWPYRSQSFSGSSSWLSHGWTCTPSSRAGRKASSGIHCYVKPGSCESSGIPALFCWTRLWEVHEVTWKCWLFFFPLFPPHPFSFLFFSHPSSCRNLRSCSPDNGAVLELHHASWMSPKSPGWPPRFRLSGIFVFWCSFDGFIVLF